MSTSVMQVENAAGVLTARESASALGSLRVQRLTGEDHKSEILNFLSARPLHTVCMADFIRHNGLASPLNRGSFYAYRDEQGSLAGVALIGHATLIDARSETALVAFARVAQECSSTHLIRGEQGMIECFWSHYGPHGMAPRLLCRELMFEQRAPLEASVGPPVGLLPATLGDLERIAEINARMLFAECGVNPLVTDCEGFRRRLARRIEQGRVWVWAERGRLFFKAEVIADTPQTIYLEGIHVHPEERGNGYGLRGMSQLGRILLKRSESLCLLVNEENKGATAFYLRAGYRMRSRYDTIYLQQGNSGQGVN